MWIKEIFIRRYGPLADLLLRPRKGLQVIFGGNESGKTMLVDALVKMLLASRGKEFARLQRVSALPEGYLLIEDAEREIKIPEEVTLEEYLGIDGHDLRNLFVIRDSDLYIDPEGGYYRRLADHITGLETDKLKFLKEHLRQYGQLTSPRSTAPLASRKDNRYFGERVSVAKKLVFELREFLAEARRQGWDREELRRVELEREVKRLQEQLVRMERAWRAQRYERMSRLLGQLKELAEQERSLAPFTEERRDLLRDLERGVEEVNRRLLRLEQRRRELKEERTRIETSLREARSQLEPQSAKLSATREIRRAADALRERMDAANPVGAILHRRVGWLFSMAAVSIGGVLGSVWLLAADGPRLAVVALGLAAVASGLAMWLLVTARHHAKLVRREGQLCRQAASHGIEARDLGGLLAALEAFERTYEERRRRHDELQQRLRRLDEELDQLDRDLVQESARLQQLQQELQALLQECGVQDVAEFEEQLRRRQQLLREMETKRGELRGQLGEPPPDADEVGWWGQQVEKLRPRGEWPRELQCDEADVEGLRDRLRRSQEEISRLQDRLEKHRNHVRELFAKGRKVLIEESLPDGEALVELEELCDLLEDFVARAEQKQRLAQRGISILEALEAEEEGKVADLLARTGEAERIFRWVTGGRYRSISLLPEEKDLEVVAADGRKFRTFQLSRGTVDQLYLAVRVALGRQRLGDRPGFFILDEAFLTSDSARLARQFELLAQLAEEGWDILYLTVKAEVRELARVWSPHPVLELPPLT